jgi:polysaccharide pyruvyl transferase WcaK-like protein
MEVVRQLLGPHADPARFCFDMGFILEPRRPARAPLAEVERLKEGGRPLVGVNVSGLLLIGGYGRDNAFNLKTDYRRFTEDLIDDLIGRKNANVLLVPHVFGTSEESDTSACRTIYEALKDRHADRLAWVQGDFDQNEIKHVIGQCDFFVGARMHACIAALSQAVPAVGIAYSLKFLGVFETVGAGELVADPRRLSGAEMMALIEQAMDRRETISAELSKTMETVRRELFATMEGVA